MNNINKVTSLELSKKIHDKTKKKGIKLESEYVWYFDKLRENKWFLLKRNSEDFRKTVYQKYCSALDISELGEMLPRMIRIDDKKVKNKHKKVIGIFKLHFYKNDCEWFLQYKEWHGEFGLILVNAKTETEARGQMYFYLLSNDLL